MLRDHLIPYIRQNLGHPPTPGQEDLIGRLVEFILDSGERKAFIVKGYAGTGKTTLISALVKTLGIMRINTLLLAPTGRAAKVFSSYAGKPAYTIHRKIYRQKSSKDGFGRFILNKNLHSNLIILVDEASMISNTMAEDSVFGSGRLLEDIISFAQEGRNCKLIFIGDTAQLPPVGTTLSPALDRQALSIYMQVFGEAILTDIVRQTSDSGILQNATIVRNHLTNEILRFPVFNLTDLTDIHFISGNELIEWLEKNYARFGLEEVIILSRSNKRANQYNKGIRQQVLFRDEELVSGDLLMVVKNNYFWLAKNTEIDFIANGDIVKIVKIHKYIDRYDFRFAYASLCLIDYNIEFESWILLDTLTSESAALGGEDNRKLYYNVLEDYAHLESRSKQYKKVKEDPFFNALQVKYAYAVTCHKAQGGQWKSVFIDQEYVKRVDLEYLRWLYTAITRASTELYLVNFPVDFLGD